MEKTTKNQNTKEAMIIFIGIGGILLIISGYFLIPFVFSQKSSDLPPLQEDVSDEEAFHFISLKEAYELLKTQEITVIDVRSASDFYTQHLIDSIHRESTEFQAFLSDTNNTNDSPVVLLIGYTEEKGSLLYTQTVLEQTFPQITIFTLSGGFSSWESASYPILRAGDPTDPTDQSKVTYITPQEAHKRIPIEDLLLLDVRASNDFKQDHIDISQNIPLPLLEKKRNELSRSKTILVYGANALESFQAGVRLFDLGFFQVLTLDGGYTTLIETAPASPQKNQE